MKLSLNAGLETEFHNLDLVVLRDKLEKRFPSLGRIAFDNSRKNDGKSWRICYDSSVSETKDGHDYNIHPSNLLGGELSTPIFRSTDNKFLNRYCSILNLIKDLGGTFDNHCGFHIHFELPNSFDPFKMLLFWLANERSIYSMVPEERWNYFYVAPFPTRLTRRYLEMPVLKKLQLLQNKGQINLQKLSEHHSCFNITNRGGKNVLEIRVGTIDNDNPSQAIRFFKYLEQHIRDMVYSSWSMLRYLN